MAHDAWSILREHFECITQVRESRLQLLTTRFETFMMQGDETISKFVSKLGDIADETFALGEEYPEVKLVKKVLKSLSERFAVKVAAVEKAKDTNTIKLLKLLGSLQTFELYLNQRKKEQTIAFKAETSEPTPISEVAKTDILEYLIVLLSRNVRRMAKRFNEQKSFNIGKGVVRQAVTTYSSTTNKIEMAPK